jgi:hypothetical protein
MWPFREQITLEIMERSVRWCIPETDCRTIKIWFKDNNAYSTYLLGDIGLSMLYHAGIFPVKK